MSHRQLTSRQFQAFQILRHLLKELHEGVYGPRSWTKSNDRSLKQVILNLTNVNDIANALAQYTPPVDEASASGQAVQEDGRDPSDVP